MMHLLASLAVVIGVLLLAASNNFTLSLIGGGLAIAGWFKMLRDDPTWMER